MSEATLARIDATLEAWERGPDAMAWTGERGPHGPNDADESYEFHGDEWVRALGVMALFARNLRHRIEGAFLTFSTIGELNVDLLNELFPPKPTLTPETEASVAGAMEPAQVTVLGVADWPSGNLAACVTREAQ